MERKRKRPKLKDNLTGTARRKPETPLYVKCPQCSPPRFIGTAVGGQEDGLLFQHCVCHNGFIETGFTQERFDRLVTRNGKLLIAVADALLVLSELPLGDRDAIKAACVFLREVQPTAEELETARSHFRTDT